MKNRRLSPVALALMLGACLTSLNGLADDSEATQRLKRRHESEFKRDVISVADGVYTGIGYTVSANSMIVGDDGVIIVDPGLQMPGATELAARFKTITDKPVVALIYTHGHPDHTAAAKAYTEPGGELQVWARASFGSERKRQAAAGLQDGARPVNTQGFDLPPEQRTGVGIAIPPYRPPSGAIQTGMRNERPRGPPPGFIPPTHTFAEARKKLEIAGVELELVAAPGETADQLYVWLPEQRVVFAGDNFYKSWPNVYPLRGTARRSTRDWIASLASMIDEKPRHVVGGHTRPILNDAIKVLTNYRDALQFVHDETIAGAKAYKTPDEIVASIELPEHLRDLDYLADYYGSIEGTVRDIYAQDLGWFDGDPLNLHRETPLDQSRRMAALLGGEKALLAAARKAMVQGDPLGAAQLAQHLVRLQPGEPGPLLILSDALAIIGEQTFNAPARNYTLAYSNRLRRMAEEK